MKHFQSELHNLMVVIERANETNDNSMPDKNILAILYEEISKDPREALRITALDCQEQSVPLDEVLTRLLASAGVAPMNRTVKIHSMESKTVTPICFRFQVNKCPFSDKCKYRHIKDPNFTPRENKENKNNNGADKKKVTPKIPNRKFTPNNHNNRLVGPPKGKKLDGHAPSYSTMQIRTLKLLANVNSVDDNDLPSEQEFNNIPTLELVADADNADALRRQLILPPALPVAPTTDTPDPEPPPDTDVPLPDPFIPGTPDPHNEIGSTYDEVGNILYWYNIQHKDGDMKLVMVETMHHG